jgi:hypothetical protein
VREPHVFIHYLQFSNACTHATSKRYGVVLVVVNFLFRKTEADTRCVANLRRGFVLYKGDPNWVSNKSFLFGKTSVQTVICRRF